MSRKRMILEEIKETNPLVPGSPDNPITIGEKAKDILVSLKLYEDDKRGGTLRDQLGYSEFSQARERLEYLRLIEYRPKYDAAAIVKQEQKIASLRQELRDSALTMASRQLSDLCQQIAYIENSLSNNTTAPFLTDAGRSVLLQGTVTVKI